MSVKQTALLNIARLLICLRAMLPMTVMPVTMVPMTMIRVANLCPYHNLGHSAAEGEYS